MLKLKYALLASLALLPMATTEAMAATAGVTAAVNQNAKSTPPGGGVRTVVLGANVVQDETIETDGGGLVQILLADGTTFTVGPNSSITIDRFVYDPSANTAQVTATIGRGVFRFIGGRTSKTEGGVQLNTPVGTVGIRGGMADLNFTAAGQIDLLFGNEVTLNGPNGSDRIFQAGYSIVFGANGAPTVIKTPPGSANFIQQALAGRPGSSGGSSEKPTDGKVAGSGVPGSNSGSTPPDPQDIPQPDLRAIELATPKPNDNHQVAENTGGSGNGNLTNRKGFSGGMLNTSMPAGYVAAPLADFDAESEFQFRDNGKLAGAKFVFGLQQSPGSGVIIEEASVALLTGSYPGAESLTASIDGEADFTAPTVDTVVTRSTQSITDCDCVNWGYWSTNFDAPMTPNSSTLSPVQLVGNWVSGDVMSSNQYDAFAYQQPVGTATYDGVVKGYGQYATSTTAAGTVKEGSGTFTMGWNFSDDEGTFEIINFTTADSAAYGHAFNADTVIGRDAMTDFFATTAPGTMSPNTEYFAVSGSFVNDGSQAAAGVIGSFNGLDTFDTSKIFTASGIFAGDRDYPH